MQTIKTNIFSHFREALKDSKYKTQTKQVFLTKALFTTTNTMRTFFTEKLLIKK